MTLNCRQFIARAGAAAGAGLAPCASEADAPLAEAPEPTRIVIECEEMRGVRQDRFGPGPGWQVGRWGHELYQNMMFGGVWASRLRTAMTDAGDNPAEICSEFDVPADGVYKVWVKYECPPFFNYAFGVRIEPVGRKGAPVFERVYGLRSSAKHYCFTDKPVKGDLYWNWGIDHDAAEGYEARLSRGRYILTIYKTKSPEPVGARSIDAVLITSNLSDISAPLYPRYPLLDELRRANNVFFRFRNPARASGPIRITWNHWGHRPVDYYVAQYRELVSFYDERGNPVTGGSKGGWPKGIQPGSVSPWYDLGPTMNTESTSPYMFVADKEGGKVRDVDLNLVPVAPSEPFSVDIALRPDERDIVRTFTLGQGEPGLCVLVQPDLFRTDGVAATRKTQDIYAEITRELNKEPRLGPVPKRLRIGCGTGAPGGGKNDFEAAMAFRQALGFNVFQDNDHVPEVMAWARTHGGIVERSLAYHHSQDIDAIVKWVRSSGVEGQFQYPSFGDEIGLPAIDATDAAKLDAFREFVRSRGETPASLGVGSWDRVKPLAALSEDVAVRIGVLPESVAPADRTPERLKRLYWHSREFRVEQGIAAFAEKTRRLKEALGDQVQTSANLGSMQPFYWMDQASFIEGFKGKAMSLAWSEDYTYCQPEASRLVLDFEVAYLRKGASYHDTPMMFYCMAHWPGNNPEQLIQNAVLEWGQNVKDFDFFSAMPDIWNTENYVAYRGGMPMFRAVRAISGMAGLLEDHLLPARTEPARIAMLLSEASDVWETEGKGQGAVEPGSIASNVSQEERKAIWYALRYAGYRVDLITEKDCAAGLLADYRVLYVCGQNIERKAAAAVKRWAAAGGVLFATAGAARKDEFDAPLSELDEVLGRARCLAYERYRGALRARLELLFAKRLDEMTLPDGKKLPVYCSRESFAPHAEARTIGTYGDGTPALIGREYGKGRGYYTGALPGQTWVKAALPVLPQGKGGPHNAPHMSEWLGWDPVASQVILMPVKDAGVVPDVTTGSRGVVTNRLKSERSTVITVVNLALEAEGALRDVDLRVAGGRPVRRAWSCFHPKGSLLHGVEDGAAVIRIPTLGPADVVILEHS